MDIRTKLALALVSISLLSMLVLGTFAYQTASELLRDVSERQLEALAETKQRDLEKVIQGWDDRVELIRSRTRLRELLARTATEDDPELPLEMARILEDAVDSVEHLDQVTLFDVSGERILSVGETQIAPKLDPSIFDDPEDVRYAGTILTDDGRIAVRFHAAMQLDGATVGAVETIIDAADLLSVTEDYTGLGESGETFIVMQGTGEQAQVAMVLTPLRHDPELRQISFEEDSYLAAALGEAENELRVDAKDYRGADIWCATRTLAALDWGIVVKMDSAEETARSDWLREQMIDLGLALGAVAILGGSLLGFRLGRPLVELREMVERFRAGERHLRADESTPDEIGVLAEALNDLLDEHMSR